MRIPTFSTLAALLLTSCAVAASPQDLPVEPPLSESITRASEAHVAVLINDNRPVYHRLDGSGWMPPGRVVAISANPEAHVGSGSSVDDPEYAKQWGLAAVGAPSAWSLAGGAGVVVAVIDTGVDGAHPDLVGRVLPGLDLVDGGDPTDPNSHGTHVAGIIAANIDNGIGVAGVARSSKVLPVRVLDERGAGDHTTIAEGIIWAVDNGASVLNLSLGGPDDSEVLRSAVQYAVSKGAVVIAAAGNDRMGANAPSYPAAYDDVLAVGATSPDDSAAMFSNTGTYVDLAAPGFAIYSTVPGGYAYASGTSQAAPFVAAAAALLRSTGLSSGEIRSTLTATARDIENEGPDPETGFGVVDISAALGGSTTPPPLGVMPSLPDLPDLELPTLPRLPTPGQPALPPLLTPPTSVVALLSAPATVPYETEFEVTVSVSCSDCSVSLSAPGAAAVSLNPQESPVRARLTAARSGDVVVTANGAIVARAQIEVVSRIEVSRTSRKGSMASVKGSVSPSGTELRLQYLRRGSWRTVATNRFGPAFEFPMALRTPGLYRVVAADGGASPVFPL